MATETVLEERFAALEAEVARLRKKLEEPSFRTSERTSPDFLDTMIGIHADSPAFEEVTRQIQEAREREREEARHLLAAEERARDLSTGYS